MALLRVCACAWPAARGKRICRQADRSLSPPSARLWQRFFSAAARSCRSCWQVPCPIGGGLPLGGRAYQSAARPKHRVAAIGGAANSNGSRLGSHGVSHAPFFLYGILTGSL